MQHVYIVGAKGVSFYGGYESFVQKLLEYHKDKKEIQYHVACKANGEGSMDVSRLEGASEIRRPKIHILQCRLFSGTGSGVAAVCTGDCL